MQILQTRDKNHSKSICVPWPLSVKQAAKITFAQWKCRTFQNIIYSAEEKTYENKQHFGMRLTSYRSTAPFYCYKYRINTWRWNSCRRSKRCWSLCTVLSTLCTFYSVLFACRAQVKQLKSEKLSPCSRGILRIQMLALLQRCLGHCQPARSCQRPAPY